MVRLRWGTVLRTGAERPGAVELRVEVEGGEADAVAYPDLVGPVAAGDRVLLNTTAVALGLGTGGVHLVVAVDGAEPGGEPGPGRAMKARYLPLQTQVETVEETHPGALDRPNGLHGTPVVVAPLHSLVAPVAAGARAAGAERVVYVMTDQAGLAGPFSRLVTQLRGAGFLDGFVTTGQSFGGDLEAITVWTGLLAATEVLGADVVVVGDGPGNLGANTRWGVSALASGNSLNAAHALGGRPVAALRISFADERERHRAVSHHSLTILADVCLVPATVAVPSLDEPQRSAVWKALRGARLEERHHMVEAAGESALDALRDAGVAVESMGRSAQDDPAFFLAGGAAGIVAGRMAAGDRRWRAEGSARNS